MDHPNQWSGVKSGKPGPLSRRLAWHIAHDHDANDPKQTEFRQRLQATNCERIPFGQRLRNARHALDLTQWMLAAELGISVRSVIRHERGSNRTGRPHQRILMRLRDLEFRYAEQIVTYLERDRHPWLPSEQGQLRP